MKASLKHKYNYQILLTSSCPYLFLNDYFWQAWYQKKSFPLRIWPKDLGPRPSSPSVSYNHKQVVLSPLDYLLPTKWIFFFFKNSMRDAWQPITHAVVITGAAHQGLPILLSPGELPAFFKMGAAMWLTLANKVEIKRPSLSMKL